MSLLFLLPLLLFWPVTVGSRTLVPADNLYQFEPYRSYAEQQGVALPPHNELLSDLVLENLTWKQFILQSIQAGEIPLWNPYLFGGAPFLAAGQHSALYPFSILFYVLPVTRAYGLFTVLQLWLAGAFMYLFIRVLRLGRLPALIAGIVYQLSAFFLVSVVFTMIIAAAAWLPLLLAIIEMMVRKQEDKGAGPFVPIWYVLAGAVALGMVILAGHPEILVYTLLVMAYYALVRLAMLWWRLRASGVVGSARWRPALRLAAWLGFMVGLGLGLGSIQLIPLVELVTRSFREGSVAYSDVVGWAYPTRQIATFLVPDFFGNPADHGYWDLVSRQWVPVGSIFWGIKNYVEAGSYVGILPLILAVVAGVGSRSSPHRRHIWIFAALAVVSLLLVFGTPLYAILYYGLPGVKQLHSPFRWIFPYTLSVAVLAGFGVDYLRSRTSRIVNWLAWAAFWSGILLVAVSIAVWAAPSLFIPLADRFLAAVEQARQAFSSGQMLLSYQWRNLLILGLMLAGSGAVVRISRCPIYLPRRLGRLPVWQPLAVAVLVADLFLFGAGFNPSADPALLDFTPPAIQFLQQRVAEEEPWRLTTYQVQTPDGSKTLNANIPWLKGLQDVRGYDSIIPRQYVEYMAAIEEQGELLYNRIAPIYGAENLSSPLLDLLNVRYVVTEGEIPNSDYKLVYDDEVRIYENIDVLPRAFALPQAEWVSPADLPARLAGPGSAPGGAAGRRARERSIWGHMGRLAATAGKDCQLFTKHGIRGCGDARARLAGPGRQLFPRLEGLPVGSQRGDADGQDGAGRGNRATDRPGRRQLSGGVAGGRRTPGALQIHAAELQAGAVWQLYGRHGHAVAGAVLAVGTALSGKRRRSCRQARRQEQPAANRPATAEQSDRLCLCHADAAHPGAAVGRAVLFCRGVHRLFRHPGAIWAGDAAHPRGSQGPHPGQPVPEHGHGLARAAVARRTAADGSRRLGLLSVRGHDPLCRGSDRPLCREPDL